MNDAGAEVEVALPEVYEVAFHLIPTLAEEQVGEEVSRIADTLKAQGAELVGERFPAKISLAYTMEKKIEGSTQRFSEAYFGWIAGEFSKDSVEHITKALDANTAVLRYLVTKTSRDAVAAIMNDPTLDSTVAHVGDDESEDLSEEALDEAIDAIVEDTEEGEEKAA